MLTLDMKGLPQGGPEKIVADHCSHFGYATVIRLLPPDNRRQYGIAAVKMRSPAEAQDVARRFGDAQFGAMVLIRLNQQRNARTAPWGEEMSSLAAEVPQPATRVGSPQASIRQF